MRLRGLKPANIRSTMLKTRSTMDFHTRTMRTLRYNQNSIPLSPDQGLERKAITKYGQLLARNIRTLEKTYRWSHGINRLVSSQYVPVISCSCKI